MKLITYTPGGGIPGDRIGALLDHERRIVDFAAAADHYGVGDVSVFNDMLALIDGGEPALAAATDLIKNVLRDGLEVAVVDAAAVMLRAPLPVPRRLRDCLAFEKHFRQARAQGLKLRAASLADPEAAERMLKASGSFEIPKAWYEIPVYYKGNHFSVVGTETEIRWPRYCERLDYEHELAIVIGKKGVNISRGEARSFIFGYTIFNDMSARDTQYREMEPGTGPAKAKDFDTGNVMGPCIVTADEIGDPYDLEMISRINGVERGRGNSGDMYHKFEDILVHASADERSTPEK